MNPILLAISLKKMILFGAIAFLIFSIIFITILFFTKGWVKVVVVVLSFILCFCAAMLVGYNYFYSYPEGYLDTMERNDGALNYALVATKSIDDDTILYVSRSVEGTGGDIHVGTLVSSMPKIISDFTCKSTSSGYGKTNTLFCNVIDGTETTYLVGYITDKNTTKVRITFYLGNDQTVEYEASVSSQIFCIMDFDDYHAQFESQIQGFSSAGRTFQRYNSSFSVGTSSKTISKLSNQ